MKQILKEICQSLLFHDCTSCTIHVTWCNQQWHEQPGRTILAKVFSGGWEMAVQNSAPVWNGNGCPFLKKLKKHALLLDRINNSYSKYMEFIKGVANDTELLLVHNIACAKIFVERKSLKQYDCLKYFSWQPSKQAIPWIIEWPMMEQDFVYPQIASNSWSRVNFHLVSPSSCDKGLPFPRFSNRAGKSVYRSATSGFMWPQRLHTMHPRIVKIVKICGRNPRQNWRFSVPLTLELRGMLPCHRPRCGNWHVGTQSIDPPTRQTRLYCWILLDIEHCFSLAEACKFPAAIAGQKGTRIQAKQLNFSFCFSPLKNNNVGFHPAHLKFVLLWLSWLFVIFRIVCSQWSLPWLTCRSLVRPPTASAAQTLWSGTGKPVPMRKSPRVWLSMTVTPQKSNWDTKNGHF